MMWSLNLQLPVTSTTNFKPFVYDELGRVPSSEGDENSDDVNVWLSMQSGNQLLP